MKCKFKIIANLHDSWKQWVITLSSIWI